ncbi:RtcB-like RNA ligase [Microbacterium phage Barnstormer]|uniref:3'-phosphate/5'-hydroxy nucleic acid ligase n=1 Tax=Microbacterium phage Barnstormer TaxID=3028491 RepID=A0AAE9ZNG7_9CAUD|nr:RtcB-like RNA ligase [Microbacterium phage Barnstormer]
MTFPITLSGTKAPVLAWADEATIEEQALQQLRDVSELPGLHGLRVMPDVHYGKGATVGSVIAMEQALAPAAVGVDIGCGVNAVRTSLHIDDLTSTDLRRLRSRFESAVPVGFSRHNPQRDSRDGLPSAVANHALGIMGRFADLRADVSSMRDGALDSLGTLGNGNHFIELTTDSTGRVWITLHSGSRGIGNQLAQRHMEKARELPANADLPAHLRELSLFYKGTPEMDAYLHDLRWAQEYAMHSRTIMMELVKRELVTDLSKDARTVTFDEEINCHHNYVAEEVIDGRQMIVTRKGAISAKEGELALIPGSMATGSYIVRGKGNASSFQSASHGAGRKMSRNAAKKRLSVESLELAMAGIEARTDEGVLDEHPDAYKNLDDVIAAQRDLVDVVEKLDTILCVKG